MPRSGSQAFQQRSVPELPAAEPNTNQLIGAGSALPASHPLAAALSDRRAKQNIHSHRHGVRRRAQPVRSGRKRLPV
jgi:hypothetical protein